MAKEITNTIQSACWECTSEETGSCSGHIIIPWDIKNKILEKRRLRRVWHASQHPEDKTTFNKATSELKNMIKADKDATLQTHLESLTATSGTNYSLCATKNFKQPQNVKPPIKFEDANWARTSQQKADVFANHLAKVFTLKEVETDDNDIDTVINQDFNLTHFSNVPVLWKERDLSISGKITRKC